MHGDGKTPGDGKTNPFGDGAGKTQGSRAMPNDFSKNPAGNAGRSKAPPSFITPDPRKTRQAPAKDETIAAQDAAQGPRTAAETPHANRPEAGVGSVGNSAKPFRVGGG